MIKVVPLGAGCERHYGRYVGVGGREDPDSEERDVEFGSDRATTRTLRKPLFSGSWSAWVPRSVTHLYGAALLRLNGRNRSI